MPFVDAYHERKKKDVMQDTWGHLFPMGATYKGLIRVAFFDHGSQIIDEEVPIDGSLWWSHELTNWLLKLEAKKPGEVWQYNIEVLIKLKKGSADLYGAKWKIKTKEACLVLASLT
jgi:hypothetical protein